jgi:hypothetical protein
MATSAAPLRRPSRGSPAKAPRQLGVRGIEVWAVRTATNSGSRSACAPFSAAIPVGHHAAAHKVLADWYRAAATDVPRKISEELFSVVVQIAQFAQIALCTVSLYSCLSELSRQSDSQSDFFLWQVPRQKGVGRGHVVAADAATFELASKRPACSPSIQAKEILCKGYKATPCDCIFGRLAG